MDVHEYVGVDALCDALGCSQAIAAPVHRWRFLDSAGRVWHVPYGVKPTGAGACRRCKQLVLWAWIGNDRRPLNVHGDSHFATCSGARRGDGRPMFDGIDVLPAGERP